MDQNPEESALIRAVVVDPDDDTPRLVYADWLDEHNQTGRARLIRAQCEIEALQAEVDDLVAAHGREWGRPLASFGVSAWKFRRGFPEEFEIQFQDIVSHAGEINNITPATHLRVTNCLTHDLDADVARLVGLPVARQFRSLELDPRLVHGESFGPDAVKAIAAAPALGALRDLSLRSDRIGTEGVAAIAHSPVLGNLTHLTLSDPACRSEENLRALVESRNLPRLWSVVLGDDPPISLRYLRSLVSSPPGGDTGHGPGR